MSEQLSNPYFSLELYDDTDNIVDGWNLELYTEEEVLDFTDEIKEVVKRYAKV